jgi:hypothetical protein
MLWNFHGLQARRARGREYEARREVGRDERDGDKGQRSEVGSQRSEVSQSKSDPLRITYNV